ncbi:hypothetical protein QTP88_014800 [Uroleucon formosanum]
MKLLLITIIIISYKLDSILDYLPTGLLSEIMSTKQNTLVYKLLMIMSDSILKHIGYCRYCSAHIFVV